LSVPVDEHPSPLAVRPLHIGPVTVDPPVLQAPMAGFTNLVYRRLVRQWGGVGLPATEMVSARGFLGMDARNEGFPERLWGVREEARPLAVQIWDNDPEKLAAVGMRLAREFCVSIVDINFGCPVKDVSENAKSGSYLLRDPDRVAAIVRRVAEVCAPTPVTAKIRLGCSRAAINACEVAAAVEAAGGAALTVHGRTAQDMYRGEADWERIAEVKSALKRIPLIGNGDLRSPADVVRVFSRYPVDGVMIGRAALQRPWIFRQCRAALRGEPIPPDPTLAEQRNTLLEHFAGILDQFGPVKGTILMRRFACCYAHGYPGARAFRSNVARVENPEQFQQVVEEYFPRAEG